MKPAKNDGGHGPLTDFLLNNPWGGQSLVCLLLSLLSGVVLALQYAPATPFYSTATIELVIPYGKFWRSLHYYSSQAFFLLLLMHLTVELVNQHTIFKRLSWIRLTTCIPVSLLLLFTGYVLRGDATGEAAGNIAEHIALSIPLFGRLFNSLLFDVTSAGMKKVYANHLIGLVVLGFICTWPHLRRYAHTWSHHFVVVFLVLVLSLLAHAPMEPDHIGLLHVAGPWFFLGLQELLRFIPPFWAGVVVPCLVLLPLFFFPFSSKLRKTVLTLMGLWLLCYGLLTTTGWWRVHW